MTNWASSKFRTFAFFFFFFFRASEKSFIPIRNTLGYRSTLGYMEVYNRKGNKTSNIKTQCLPALLLPNAL